MAENPWTAADIGLLGIKLHMYTYQLMLAKGLVTTQEVQNLVNQLLANLKADPSAGGVYPLAVLVLKDIPGITTE